MKSIRKITRIIHINLILIKYGLDEIVLSIPVFKPVRFLSYMNPVNWFRSKKLSRGERVCAALEELGPFFVKFGQLLSTRTDIIPLDIAKDLEKLQDRVAPFSTKKAIAILEAAYEQPIQEVFAEFDEKSLASASIAQVHAVKLFDGHDAVIKILRPNIEKKINQDLELLYMFARIADRYWSEAYRVHPIAIVAEFERVILAELDLPREAANASELKRNLSSDPRVYIPKIFWNYCREQALVMERIHGIPVHRKDQLIGHNINLKKLSEQLIEIFFTQVFRDGFFHADLHPGNIFVSTEHPDDPQIILVDFGIMGALSQEDLRYLAENFYAFFNREYYRVAELHVESGWMPMDVNLQEFTFEIRTVCEPLADRPLKDISFANILMRLFQIGRKFRVNIQPQLLLLQKTLLTVESISRNLYPDLDMWQTAKPFLEKWLRGKKGVRATLKKACQNIPAWLERLPEMPMLIYQNLRKEVNAEIAILKEKPVVKFKKFWPMLWVGLALGFFVHMIIDVRVAKQHVEDWQLGVMIGFLIVAMLSFIFGDSSKTRR